MKGKNENNKNNSGTLKFISVTFVIMVAMFLVMAVLLTLNNLEILPPNENNQTTTAPSIENNVVLSEGRVREIARESYESYRSQTQTTLMIAAMFITMIAIVPPLVQYFAQKERMEKLEEATKKAEDAAKEAQRDVQAHIKGKTALEYIFEDEDEYPLHKNVRTKIEEKNFPGAFEVCKKAFEEFGNPNEEKNLTEEKKRQLAEIHSAQAMVYRWSKHYYKSLEEAREARKLDPKKPRYHYQLAVAYRGLRCFDRTLTHIELALRFEKTRKEEPRPERLAHYYNVRGTTFHEARAFKDALYDFREAIEEIDKSIDNPSKDKDKTKSFWKVRERCHQKDEDKIKTFKDARKIYIERYHQTVKALEDTKEMLNDKKEVKELLQEAVELLKKMKKEI